MFGRNFIFLTIIIILQSVKCIENESHGGTTDLDRCFEVISNAVNAAGDKILRELNRDKNVQFKRHENDLVTETDLEIQNFLVNAINSQFPDHKIIGEESGKRESIEMSEMPTWAIDPIDGTINFYHNYPHSSISVALFVNRTTEIGIIYNPTLKQLFTARRGKGAFYNGNQIYTSNQTDIRKSLIAADPLADVEYVSAIVNKANAGEYWCHGIRALGSLALQFAMVAQGGADVAVSADAKIWDIAAGDLIVREAGGVTYNLDGGTANVLTGKLIGASTPEVALSLINLHRKYKNQTQT